MSQDSDRRDNSVSVPERDLKRLKLSLELYKEIPTELSHWFYSMVA